MTTETKYSQSEIESEAAIYAEDTRFTRDDLVEAWNTFRRDNERLQDFFERFLAEDEGNTMTTKTKLYAVRAAFDDPAGSLTHEFIYGDDPTVFYLREVADKKAAELNREALSLDWGDMELPIYSVEEITEAEVWESERLVHPSVQANADAVREATDCAHQMPKTNR